MREILEALKEYIIRKLAAPCCKQCGAYEKWLDTVIEEKEELKKIILINTRLITENEPTVEQEFKSISKRVPLRIRIAKAEAASREKLKKEVVVVAEDSIKTEAEKVFEAELNDIRAN